MSILLASFILFFSNAFACDFRKDVKSVYSLSGPITLALRDLGLIKNKTLKGVSIFHPISKKEFKGEFLPGGVFLSHNTIKSFNGSLIFYDESRELSRMFSRYKEIHSIEIKSRAVTPLEVMTHLEAQLAPYLVGCDLSGLSKKLKERQDYLKSIAAEKLTMLFFLGAIQNEKYPDLLMVNDGVVKWLVTEKLIKTYPSTLAYVNWSAKIMQELPKDYLKVGIKDSGNSLEEKIEKKDRVINLTYPGALIPGSGQVEAMIYLFKNL
jgi:hypothetical protein